MTGAPDVDAKGASVVPNLRVWPMILLASTLPVFEVMDFSTTTTPLGAFLGIHDIVVSGVKWLPEVMLDRM